MVDVALNKEIESLSPSLPLSSFTVLYCMNSMASNLTAMIIDLFTKEEKVRIWVITEWHALVLAKTRVSQKVFVQMSLGQRIKKYRVDIIILL